MFGLFKKKEEPQAAMHADNEIIAPFDASVIPLADVNDEVFSSGAMGDGIAFSTDADTFTVCAPANGKLSVLFPTGHAFGITMANGVELLIHIGIDTVESKGSGFETLKKQDQTLRAGDPVVRVNTARLREKYDMTTMLIVTEANGKEVIFDAAGTVSKGTAVGRVS